MSINIFCRRHDYGCERGPHPLEWTPDGACILSKIPYLKFEFNQLIYNHKVASSTIVQAWTQLSTLYHALYTIRDQNTGYDVHLSSAAGSINQNVVDTGVVS